MTDETYAQFAARNPMTRFDDNGNPAGPAPILPAAKPDALRATLRRYQAIDTYAARRAGAAYLAGNAVACDFWWNAYQRAAEVVSNIQREFRARAARHGNNAVPGWDAPRA